MLSHKRRIIALNKKDLANPNMMHVSDCRSKLIVIVLVLLLADATDHKKNHLRFDFPIEEFPCNVQHWIRIFDSKKQDCIAVNALAKHSVSQVCDHFVIWINLDES